MSFILLYNSREKRTFTKEQRMSRMEQVELTNMCMICSGDSVLVQNKLSSSWGGVCFPGGHVEAKESFVDSVIREVKEETGLDIWNVKLCGVKQYNPEDGSYRYVVFLFKTDCFSGEIKSSAEGKVFWVPRSTVRNYPLAPGFEYMLDVFEDDSLTENYYYTEDGKRKVRNI
jgi:8-oxo-dGTP diphosphatase